MVLLSTPSVPGSEDSELSLKAAGPSLPPCTLTVWVPASNFSIPIIFFLHYQLHAQRFPPSCWPQPPPGAASDRGDALEPCEGRGFGQSPFNGHLSLYEQNEETAPMLAELLELIKKIQFPSCAGETRRHSPKVETLDSQSPD